MHPWKCAGPADTVAKRPLEFRENPKRLERQAGPVRRIYKICPASAWREAERQGVYRGSADEIRGGFIHFPHLYGELDLGAVTGVLDLRARSDGTHDIPELKP